MTKRFAIAVLPGDGVGGEVIHEAVKALRAVERLLPQAQYEMAEFSVGAGEYLRSGDPLPQAAFDACRRADAVLLGAMGLPDVRWPTGVEMAPQLDLRERLDLFGGLRPVRLYHPSDSPLRAEVARSIDMLLVRESTEGLFAGRKDQHPSDASAVSDRMVVTRRGAERVIRLAFQEAVQRRGHLTLVDKANVLPSMAFFRRVFDEVAREFPSVRTDRIYVDAAALYLVRRPSSFDVLVTENMFGDILSDLMAGLVGGMGMAPSADIGESCAVFQPAHGSAPDIAGKGLANPVATILSAALMLRWLRHPASELGARLIEGAVERVLSNPALRTRDMGGRLTCGEMGDLVRDEILAGGVESKELAS